VDHEDLTAAEYVVIRFDATLAEHPILASVFTGAGTFCTATDPTVRPDLNGILTLEEHLAAQPSGALEWET